MVSTKAQADNLMRKRLQSAVKGIESVKEKEVVKENEKIKEIEEPVNRSFVSFMYFWYFLFFGKLAQLYCNPPLWCLVLQLKFAFNFTSVLLQTKYFFGFWL